MSRLEGRTAIITGGASGIGAASVRLFVDEGARVVIADAQEDRGEALAGELGESAVFQNCLLYTSPSPRDQRGSRMPSSA